MRARRFGRACPQQEHVSQTMTYGVANRDMQQASSGGGGADGIDIWSLLVRVWARKWFLMLFVSAGVVLAYVAVSMVTPHYTGEVRILIEGRTADPTVPLSSQNVREADQQKIESEIQVLLSRTLADGVITALKLETWDEFSSSGGGLFGLGTKKAANRADVVDAYFERLNVYQLGESRVIAVDFWAEHPRSAMIVANAIADLYVSGQLDAQVAVTRRASSWLDQQVEKLRGDVQASEAAVETFRRQNGLFETNGNLLKTEELSELNTQLILASAAKAEARARLDGARALLNSPAGIETSSEVLDSNLIQQLREQEVALQRQITELSADLLPQHPDMISRQAELDDLRRAIGAEVGKIVRRLENEVRVAAARETALRRSIAGLKKEVSTEKQRESELQSLEREASANRGLLESFLLRASEAGARDDRSIQRPEARVISRAETPESASFPQKAPILMLAFMASLTISLLIVLGTEMLAAAPLATPVGSRQPSFRSQPFVASPASYDQQVPVQPAYGGQPGYGQTAYQQPAHAAFYPAYRSADGLGDGLADGRGYGPVHRYGEQYQPPRAAYPAQQAAPQATEHTYSYQQVRRRVPVTQMVTRLPGSPTMTQHDQWLLGQAAQDILRFVASRPVLSGARRSSRIVRVAGGNRDGRDLAGLARLLSQQGVSIVVIGGGARPDAGFTDVVARQAGFEHVTRRDAHSTARFISWGSIPVSDDPTTIRSALEAVAQTAQLVLVGDPDGAAYGLSRSFDAAADTALVLMRGSQPLADGLPQTQTAGLIQIQ